MKEKSHIRLAAMFSLAVFTVMLITMILIGIVAMILFRLGLAHNRSPFAVIFLFMIISVVLGTLIAVFGAKRPLAPILEINEATKEIAKGNFDIQLNEDGPAREINEMAHNFMLMAKELANTETFHNDFINNVSHEFKTPLSAIEGYATLLQNKNLDEAKREMFVEKILYNTKRLSALTGNILQLTRLENQNIVTGKKKFFLDEQIRENILLYEEEWQKKQLELNIELDTVEYYGNSDLLTIVWQNLIGNAMKFVKDGGFVYITLSQEKDWVKVTVTDNGVGMDDEVKSRVFDKFYQGDSSHSSEGNGLGLTLTRRIIDLHEGRIEVSSKPGKGTTFTVRLPA